MCQGCAGFLAEARKSRSKSWSLRKVFLTGESRHVYRERLQSNSRQSMAKPSRTNSEGPARGGERAHGRLPGSRGDSGEAEQGWRDSPGPPHPHFSIPSSSCARPPSRAFPHLPECGHLTVPASTLSPPISMNIPPVTKAEAIAVIPYASSSLAVHLRLLMPFLCLERHSPTFPHGQARLWFSLPNAPSFRHPLRWSRPCPELPACSAFCSSVEGDARDSPAW